MRVAFISFGFGEYSVRHVNAFAEAGVPTLLAIPADALGEYASEIRDDVTIHLMKPARMRQPVAQFRRLRELVRRIEEFQPDIIHVQNGQLWFNQALRWLNHYPLVLTLHDAQRHPGDRASLRNPQFLLNVGYRRADRIIVHGEKIRSKASSRFDISERQIDVVPHIALGKCSCDTTVTEEPATVLFFGRIWPYKGLGHLIRAEPLVSARIPGVRFIIAGEGENFARYENMMQNRERFEIHNRWISDEEQNTFFQRASLVALPYVEASQSGVIPIASTHSTPVIASRVGCLPEVVQHGKTGWLVPPGDEVALADAIVKLLTDGELRKRLGRAAHSIASESASPARVAQATLRVYQHAIDDFSRLRGEDVAVSGKRSSARTLVTQGAGNTKP